MSIPCTLREHLVQLFGVPHSWLFSTKRAMLARRKLPEPQLGSSTALNSTREHFLDYSLAEPVGGVVFAEVMSVLGVDELLIDALQHILV